MVNVGAESDQTLLNRTAVFDSQRFMMIHETIERPDLTHAEKPRRWERTRRDFFRV